MAKYEKELAQCGDRISTNVFAAFTAFCIFGWVTTTIVAKYDDRVISTESIKLSNSRTGMIKT